jgi:FKBP-type peptidyl-prolyl cis-trans isomerase FklB
MKAFSLTAALVLPIAGLSLCAAPVWAQTPPPPCKAGKALARTDKAEGADANVLRINLAKAKSFMADNGKQPGVVKLRSGLQYKVISSAPADATCVNPDLRLRIQYEGTLPDGTVFDTTMGGAPAVYRLDELIRGWKEVVPMMRIGDEWMIYVPPEYGYGEKGALGGKVPANSALIFKLKVLGMLG